MRYFSALPVHVKGLHDRFCIDYLESLDEPD